MDKKKIYLSSPKMHGEEMAFIKEAFDANWVAPLGFNVDGFEKEMSEYIGCKDAAALSSGTAAIHLALKLCGVKEGDIVLASDLTFSATVNPICYEKAIPVFVDSEKETWNMDPDALREAFKKYPQTKAVICVHLYGTPAKIDEIRTICDEHYVPLIEDSAESLGSSYKGQLTGTFGRFGILSFNGNKIITTSGGGMLLSDDEAAIKRARFLATQAREPAEHYQHKEIGYNYRMSNIVAGIGRGQLLHLNEHLAKKKEIYKCYQEAFADIPEITMNPLNPDGDANCWLSCITVSSDSSVSAKEIRDAMREENIECRPIWKPMHLQPVFENCDFVTMEKEGSVGEDIFNRGLCLSSDVNNTQEDMARIIHTVKKLFAK